VADGRYERYFVDEGVRGSAGRADGPLADEVARDPLLEHLRPGSVVGAERRSEGRRLAERDDAVAIPLLERDLGAPEAERIDPPGRFEEVAGPGRST